MGRARGPAPPLPGLLDRRPRQDGLQAQVPPAGRFRRPPLAALRRDRSRMSRRLPALPALAVIAALALAACVRINVHGPAPQSGPTMPDPAPLRVASYNVSRSEEHTSELQSRENLVCRLLLE